MDNMDWRHWSGIAAVAGAVSIALYEQFGGPKVELVHDMTTIRDFCFTYSGYMFGNLFKGTGTSSKESSPPAA